MLAPRRKLSRSSSFEPSSGPPRQEGRLVRERRERFELPAKRELLAGSEVQCFGARDAGGRFGDDVLPLLIPIQTETQVEPVSGLAHPPAPRHRARHQNSPLRDTIEGLLGQTPVDITDGLRGTGRVELRPRLQALFELGLERDGDSTATRRRPFPSSFLRYPGQVESNTVPAKNKKNVKLRNQRHPDTDIVYSKRGLPVFDDVAVYETRLPDNVVQVRKRAFHMQQATRDLNRAIEAGEVSASRFTPDQLEAIRAGSEKIPGYTWRHHEEVCRMQLVPENVHGDTGHLGGYNLWYEDKESK